MAEDRAAHERGQTVTRGGCASFRTRGGHLSSEPGALRLWRPVHRPERRRAPL